MEAPAQEAVRDQEVRADVIETTVFYSYLPSLNRGMENIRDECLCFILLRLVWGTVHPAMPSLGALKDPCGDVVQYLPGDGRALAVLQGKLAEGQRFALKAAEEMVEIRIQNKAGIGVARQRSLPGLKVF